MRAMKDSGIEWIGQIPQNWETKKLKFLVDLRTDKTAVKTVPAPYVGLEHVASSVGTLIEDYEVILDFAGDTLDFKAGDVLFGKLRPYLAKAIHAETDGRCSSEFWVMDPQSIDGHFLLYAVLSHGFISCIDQSTFGVKMPRAEWEYAGNQELALPDSDTQRRIAEYLDAKCADIDALIAAKEKTNALLKERRQSIIYEAVTKGLNPDAPMKDSGVEWIGQIPENWDTLRLRFLGAFQNGISKAGEFFGSGYPFVSYGDVYKNEVLPTIPSGLVESTEAEQELYSVQKGDVFFTRTSETKEEIGIVAVCKETIPNATFAGFLIRMRPTTDVVTTDFLRYYFSCGLQREYFSKEMTLVTRASLGQDLLKNMVVTIPTAEEQQEIVNYLDELTQAIDNIIASNDVSIQKLKEYRQSIIYEAVTGKIEV